VSTSIAIVGQACVLPGALTPEALWANVAAGKSAIGPAPAGRWRVDAQRVVAADGGADRAFTDRGGYVGGFDEVWSPEGFALPADALRGLDPLFHWVLHAGREALRPVESASRARAGLVLGNLSYPTVAAGRFAEATWIARQGEALFAAAGLAAEIAGLPAVDPRNRFSSGLPAHLAAAALGLGGRAFALDAACASGLYALDLACRALERGDVDLMLAGAVNRADDLFLHIGFTALSALSRSGQSRPFHAGADGLLPGEGAVVLALKRLDDARRDGDAILGVVRGVGVSNDGRGRGVLSPSSEGQQRAMRAAYARAGLTPADVAMVECHATGTAVGDATELESMAAVFAGSSGVPIGSLKSNLGHLITAAGLAGVLKVLGAFRAGVKPPTLHADQPTPALAGTPFRLLTRAEPWTGPRRAAVSAFGFGGNNAHAILEAPEESVAQASSAPRPRPRGEVAVVAVALQIGDASSPAEVARALAAHDAVPPRRTTPLRIAYRDLATTPRELLEALPQQLAVLVAARDAAAQLPRPLPRERTAVFVGMGCDPAVTRWGARWRLPEWSRRWGAALGVPVDPAWADASAEPFAPALTSAAVIGTMPNIPANRINRALDLGGPGFTVASEELSGLRALELGCEALRAGEVDAALVGAVDFATEPVHEAACAALGMPAAGGDASAVWILKRREDAERDGDHLWAIIPEVEEGARTVDAGVKTPFGRPHAALALVDATVRLITMGAAPPGPARAERELSLRYQAMLGQVGTLVLRAPDPPRDLPEAPMPEGAVVEVPAHMGEVRFGPLRTVERAPIAAATGGPSVVLAAPVLPSVAEEEVAAPVIVAPPPLARVIAEPLSSPAPVALEPPAVPGMAASPSLRAMLLERATRRLERVQEVHIEHLDAQRRLIADLARITETATVLLAAGASGQVLAGSDPIPIPSPPIPSPPIPSPPIPSSPISYPYPAALSEGNRDRDRDGAEQHPGPKFSRRDLEILASGKISSIFGPLFAQQDGYRRQVRMPMPPLLLADRVTGILGEPGSMGRGTLWTETDVGVDAWYLHDGRMPAGVVIESGQADLLLISWLGADFENRGERVYRLLGCEATWHGPLPAPGDTLVFDIHVDGHARHGDVRLFFFHYDCTVRSAAPGSAERRVLSVRGGQAGFFTEAELGESGGVLWSPDEERIDPATRLDPPAVRCARSELGEAEITALAEGRLADGLGAGYEIAAAHVWTPRIQGGSMRLFDRVTALDPRGGPWGRGYLRATLAVTPDRWFFEGHFKNDPCMPGTLMFEGCVQAMGVYLLSLGYSLDKDGWRFEPVAGERVGMRCRGQVVPSSRELVYEIFVREVHEGPLPTIWADILCSVDGLKAFHAGRVGLRLVPCFPMSRPALRRALPPDPEPVAERGGVRFGLAAMLASARGMPSEALGSMYARFDGHRRAPRLPGEPYHFMSRVTRVDGAMGGMEQGTTVEVAYDVPPDAWYFAPGGTMPLCVIMEVALQPCGWIASYVGSVLGSEIDLKFRNLDGTATLHEEVRPDAGTVRTRAVLKSIARAGEMILQGFEVECTVGGRRVYSMTTSFGFFPADAFESQEGLLPTADERAAMAAPSDATFDLASEPARYFGGPLALSRAPLRMLDRVTGLWPQGGKRGAGRARAEKTIAPGEWFFRAHFYQDPVQPGSLGVEAIVQLAQLFIVEQGLAGGIADPHFEPVALGRAVTWKYRGQVVPLNHRVEVEVEVVEVRREASRVEVVFDGALWVDGKRIYRVMQLAVGVHGEVGRPSPPPRDPPSGAEVILDPAREPWMLDHAPTWTVPVLPMTAMLDRLARAAEEVLGAPVAAIEGAQVHRWLTLPGPTRTRTEVRRLSPTEAEVTLLGFRDAATASLSRFEKVASARVTVGPPGSPPAALAPLVDATLQPDPYAADELFQGPPFHLMRAWRLGREGASSRLDATPTAVPVGSLHPALLDASLHGIPGDASIFSPDLRPELAPLPYRVPRLRVFGPVPTAGEVRCEIRFLGTGEQHRFPEFLLQLVHGDRVWLEWVITMIGLPKGSIGMAPGPDRRAFLRERRFVPGMRLSSAREGLTTLTREAVQEIAWLPGTVEAVYGSADVAQIAAREHLGHRLRVHPSAVQWDGVEATSAHDPIARYPLRVETAGAEVQVADAGPPRQELGPISTWWRDWLGPGTRAVEDLFFALVRRFVGRVVIVDPPAFAALRGRPVLYLANHQTMVESLLFVVLLGPLADVPTLGLAKIEHRTSWIGHLSAAVAAWPGARDPRLLEFFDRNDKEALPGILQRIAGRMAAERQSLLVHVEGTRSLACGVPVQKISSVIIDMAVHARAAIVPVRFSGGLPRTPLGERLDFPLGFGRQDHWVGKPLLPEALAAMPYGERRAAVVAAINGTGPSVETEQPNPGDPELAHAVEAWAARTGARTAHAAILMALARERDLQPAWQRVLEGMRTGTLVVGDTAEDRAVAAIAADLYGPNGPRVVVG
jgi:3-oxoacyl-(acyl-carrier-protein) synthase/3-hydroxymyristoyl/3-hydroxydecanoyl-(acyl carrier protein) dehydratase/1-acyl-sn-glycerol-3-phosphate acyltransferase